jgi:hypothetical protein
LYRSSAVLQGADKDPKREFKVGDRVTVSLSGGRIVYLWQVRE